MNVKSGLGGWLALIISDMCSIGRLVRNAGKTRAARRPAGAAINTYICVYTYVFLNSREKRGERKRA